MPSAPIIERLGDKFIVKKISSGAFPVVVEIIKTDGTYGFAVLSSRVHKGKRQPNYHLNKKSNYNM
mgnify:CR=1 FL=1